MNLGKTFISLIVLFLVVGGLLVFQATRSSASMVVTPTELVTHGRDQGRIRLAGKVADREINYQVEPSIVLKFSVEDPSAPSAVNHVLPVVYEGVKPDMFATGRNVLIDGEFRGGTIYATNLLTQCPSKYEPALPKKP